MIFRDIEALFKLLVRLPTYASIVWHGLGSRAELAKLEAQEAAREVANFVVLIMVAMVCVMLTALSATLLVAAIFWDTPYRVTALAVLAGLEIACAIGACLWLFSRWRRWAPFSAIKEQLREDSQCIEALIPTKEKH